MKRSVYTLEVETRELLGTANSRRLRRQGKIPAIMYSHGKDGKFLLIDDMAAADVVHHPGMLTISNKAEGQTTKAIIKDVAYNVITQKVMHIDLLEVHAGEVISADVILMHKGTPKGLSHGGLLEQMLHTIHVRCTPEKLPEVITVDVSDLEIDQILHVEDIALPDGVTVTTDGKLPAFIMATLRTEEEIKPEASESETEQDSETEDAERKTAE
jgi:large subunit ribosomal protein L25